MVKTKLSQFLKYIKQGSFRFIKRKKSKSNQLKKQKENRNTKQNQCFTSLKNLGQVEFGNSLTPRLKDVAGLPPSPSALFPLCWLHLSSGRMVSSNVLNPNSRVITKQFFLKIQIKALDLPGSNPYLTIYSPMIQSLKSEWDQFTQGPDSESEGREDGITRRRGGWGGWALTF